MSLWVLVFLTCYNKIQSFGSVFVARVQHSLQWIQDPSQSNVDNLNNVRHDASRHFRNKKKAYLKAKIEELETNSKIKNIRDLYKESVTSRRVTSLELT
jgi:hypothetical protein